MPASCPLEGRDSDKNPEPAGSLRETLLAPVCSTEEGWGLSNAQGSQPHLTQAWLWTVRSPSLGGGVGRVPSGAAPPNTLQQVRPPTGKTLPQRQRGVHSPGAWQPGSGTEAFYPGRIAGARAS